MAELAEETCWISCRIYAYNDQMKVPAGALKAIQAIRWDQVMADIAQALGWKVLDRVEPGVGTADELLQVRQRDPWPELAYRDLSVNYAYTEFYNYGSVPLSREQWCAFAQAARVALDRYIHVYSVQIVERV
jgi:hypothetical protein